MSEISKCCKAEVKVANGEDFGDPDDLVTCWYECTKCEKPCDLFVEDEKKIKTCDCGGVIETHQGNNGFRDSWYCLSCGNDFKENPFKPSDKEKNKRSNCCNAYEGEEHMEFCKLRPKFYHGDSRHYCNNKCLNFQPSPRLEEWEKYFDEFMNGFTVIGRKHYKRIKQAYPNYWPHLWCEDEANEELKYLFKSLVTTAISEERKRCAEIVDEIMIVEDKDAGGCEGFYYQQINEAKQKILNPNDQK